MDWIGWGAGDNKKSLLRSSISRVCLILLPKVGLNPFYKVGLTHPTRFDNVGRLLEQLKMQRKEKMGLVIVLDSQVFPRVSRYLKCIAHISFDKGDEKHKR